MQELADWVALHQCLQVLEDCHGTMCITQLKHTLMHTDVTQLHAHDNFDA